MFVIVLLFFFLFFVFLNTYNFIYFFYYKIFIDDNLKNVRYNRIDRIFYKISAIIKDNSYIFIDGILRDVEYISNSDAIFLRY